MDQNLLSKPKILQPANFRRMIQNSLGSRLFQNLYAEEGGKEIDLLRGGLVSCAVFVSTILYLFKLVSDRRATVASLIHDLESSGWSKTSTPVSGAVLIWEPARQAGGELHPHAGFYVGDGLAISHSDVERVPVEHHYTFNAARNIIAIYTHPFLQ